MNAKRLLPRPLKSFGLRFLKSFLQPFGLRLVAATPREEVLKLLSELRPRLTNCDLIRLGPPGDGGYLVPNDLNGIVACFSPGVGGKSLFEAECAEMGMDVYMADGSVDGPSTWHQRFTFEKSFIGPVEDGLTISFERWADQSISGEEGDLILQMDIEGAEWEVLPSIPSEIFARFRIVVIEFHGLDELFTRATFSHYAAVLRRILGTHTCVHLHPNNCCSSVTEDGIEIPRVLEATFLRSDRVQLGGYVKDLPHPLDADNTKNPPLRLTRSLFGSN